MQNEIDAKIEAARRELLDLGLRNPLLNYRTRTRRIDVVDELSTEVFRILVTDGRAMTFAPLPGELGDEEGQGLATLFGTTDPDWAAYFSEDGDSASEGVAGRHVDNVLQTRLESKSLHTRLISIHRDARTLLEEQGVNILYLALGFLHWYESDDSDKERIAPLILVPIELERGSVAEKFKLKYSGEEVGANLSLMEMLRTQFKFMLPDMTESETFDVTAYLSAVENKIAGHRRWRVEPDQILLGFFSYGKFLMYKDLAPEGWSDDAAPSDHEILSALLGDGFREPPLVASETTNVDELVAPGDMHQILDADSSQTLAIYDISEGRNLVIQGPPGTGKSQTIANVIANAVGAGKKVLFVSEKMAALEVVKRRLDNVGLGDAALELHSHKTRKRAVLEELRRTLEAGRPKVGNVDDDFQTLTSLRDRLNDYCEAINAPILKSNVSPVAAIGHLRGLGEDQGALPRMNFDAMREWTQATFREHRLRVEELEKRLKAIGVPKESPFWGVGITVLVPGEESQLREQATALRDNTVAITSQSQSLAGSLSLPPPRDLQGIVRVAHAAQRVLDAPDLKGVAVDQGDWQTRREDIGTLTSTGQSIRDLRDRFDSVLLEEAWDQDVLEERQHLMNYGDKWWRIMSGKYRAARARLRGLLKSELPKQPKECLKLVEVILDGRRLQKVYDEFEGLGTRLFGERWRGDKSDWAQLASLSAWVADVHAGVAEGKLPKELIGSLQGKVSTAGVRQALARLVQDFKTEQALLKELEGRLNFNPKEELIRQPLQELSAKLDSWLIRWDELRLFASYNAFSEEIKSLGAGTVIDLAEDWDRAAQDLVRAFDATWYEGLLDAAYRGRSALAQFDRISHEHVIEKFRELDVLVFEHNRARLARAHWSMLPSPGHGGEVNVIHNELNKKRRHLPIRKLVAQAGRALQAIKPVFMMSPMSIANFLPPQSVTFDLVVFDEASQVRPVDAFGAILRGRQIVVVGDSKQLPPTSFFDTLVSDDALDEEEESGTQDLESILSVFLARGAPQAMLRWHYRSQHESLIAVSNHEFYDDKLVVFPSPDYGRENLGLRFHHLPHTHYDRGRTRTNPEEARAVAEKVMNYARSCPHLTMGVAAFSTAQRDAIGFQLELMRRRDTSAEDYFASHPEEPFFVKNLENVQGDERDIVLISIGYGKTQEGYMPMSFGPLNQDGGERRLNVLITRARRICDVFANFTADDLDLSRSDKRGVVALKTFLVYAKDGRLDVPVATGAEPDSPFEESVIRALTGHGFQVHPQVGAGGFRIDLGVVDSEKPGRYLLGIECDGASYHSAQSARDRDRIRQDVLEKLGWRIHRIWSTDWFREPAKETKRAIEAIERARVYWVGKSQAPSEPAPRPSKPRPTQIERTEERVHDSDAVTTAPYEFAQLDVRLGQRQLGELRPTELAPYVERVVATEGPIHVDQLIARITAGAGLSRAGNRIRQAVTGGIKQSCRNKKVRQRGDFLYSPGAGVVPRDRSDWSAQDKKLEFVSPEEILVTLVQVVKGAYRISMDDAIGRVCRLLGFQRVTARMTETVEALVKAKATSLGIQLSGAELVWKGTA